VADGIGSISPENFAPLSLNSYNFQCATIIASRAAAVRETEDPDVVDVPATANALQAFVEGGLPQGYDQASYDTLLAILNHNMLLPSMCADKCGAHGHCEFGGCRCDPGWGGLNCKQDMQLLLRGAQASPSPAGQAVAEG
jgi:hypothetical protein